MGVFSDAMVVLKVMLRYGVTKKYLGKPLTCCYCYPAARSFIGTSNSNIVAFLKIQAKTRCLAGASLKQKVNRHRSIFVCFGGTHNNADQNNQVEIQIKCLSNHQVSFEPRVSQ